MYQGVWSPFPLGGTTWVGFAASLHNFKGLAQFRPNLAKVSVMQIQLAVDGGNGVGQFILLLLEQIQGDGLGVVGLQELALLALQFIFFTLQPLPLGGEFIGGLLDFRLQPALQFCPEFRGEGNLAIQGFHLPLDFLDQDGALLAVVASPVSKQIENEQLRKSGRGPASSGKFNFFTAPKARGWGLLNE